MPMDSHLMLGNQDFKDDYGLRYAYLAGAMYKGIASPALVIKLGKAGLMGFFGTGGLRLEKIETAIQDIQQHLKHNESYGMNLLCNLVKPVLEDQTVDLFFKYGIKSIEAAAYVQMTPSLVRYRLKNLHLNCEGKIEVSHRILAKVSRPEVAEAFMSPAPPNIVRKLVESGQLTQEEARLSEKIPMAHDICVEADSGGHTDQGVAYALMPAMLRLRDEIIKRYAYEKAIRIGAAGGIGTPEAAAAAFMLGADFIMTGSINQCTVEAGTSDNVKDLLQNINVQDTTYAPAGDMFEFGAKVQVVRKGLLFPARANKLYDLYRQYNALEEIDEKIGQQIQEKYFKCSFEEVWEETRAYYAKEKPEEIEKAKENAKHKMALIFRWYFIYTTRLALQGNEAQRANYQIQCGPALGAFNQWVKGTSLENWRNRHVDEIAEKLMKDAALLVTNRMEQWSLRTIPRNR
nr:PfaD family polyunsaturated fatty acid/polyketide biosynthesis protein [Candidatus Paracaedibacter acanthamoebae]